MLEKTWRWFGPKDRITLKMIQQTGVTGIVSALYSYHPGEVWPLEEIHEYKKHIEANGFSWSVAESVPVHEDIKKRTGDYKRYISHYKRTIDNLGKEGIKTICYNFMPVLDWVRTDLRTLHEDGSLSTSFTMTDFAIKKARFFLV